MSRLLGLGACQTVIESGNIERNLDFFNEQVSLLKSFSPWVKLVCAPELCFQGLPNWQEDADPIPGPVTEQLGDIAQKHKIYLIPGSIFEVNRKSYYNTCPIIGPEGQVIDKYQKMYPWHPYEKAESGRNTVVFQIPEVGKIGVCIGYDLWFPEVIRDLVCKGAEVIIIPTQTNAQDRQKEVILAQAAAISNQCFIVSINAVSNGSYGRSLIVDPEGNITRETGQNAENMLAQLNLDQVEAIRHYGTGGISRPLASYLFENHRFQSQDQVGDDMRSDPTTLLFKN